MTGEELKAIIRKSGWKQGDVARELGMSPQNFSAKFKSNKIASDLVERVQDVISRPCNGNVSVGGDANNTNINSTTLDKEIIAIFREQLDRKDELIKTLSEIIHDQCK